MLYLCKGGNLVDRSNLKAGSGAKAFLVARAKAEGRRELLTSAGQERVRAGWGCRAGHKVWETSLSQE